MFCTKCGNTLLGDGYFCPGCGEVNEKALPLTIGRTRSKTLCTAPGAAEAAAINSALKEAEALAALSVSKSDEKAKECVSKTLAKSMAASGFVLATAIAFLTAAALFFAFSLWGLFFPAGELFSDPTHDLIAAITLTSIDALVLAVAAFYAVVAIAQSMRTNRGRVCRATTAFKTATVLCLVLLFLRIAASFVLNGLLFLYETPNIDTLIMPILGVIFRISFLILLIVGCEKKTKIY